MTDIDTIRELHWQNPDGECASDDHAYPSAWPCDTRVVLDALDRHLRLNAEALKQLGEADSLAANYNTAYVAARTDADRLAEALRPIVTKSWPYDSTHNTFWAHAREALRQHDDLTKEG